MAIFQMGISVAEKVLYLLEIVMGKMQELPLLKQNAVRLQIVGLKILTVAFTGIILVVDYRRA